MLASIPGARSLTRPRWIALAVAAALLLLAFYRLTEYPLTWFDEGSHLHVPKTLVRFGVYADYSSDGYRHYGPTIGVGPTVMLPIAAMFKLFGIGLGQARMVMALYLLAAAGAFYLLARQMGGARLGLAALALLVASRGVGLLEYGRQVLGEVPGLFFMVLGFWLWFEAWERAGWRRLTGVGLLLGLAVVTKQQYLLVLAPTLLLAWLANLFYYRTAPQRVFLVPGILTAAAYGVWQIYLIVYLGPATASENLELFRAATAGAALVFSPALMRRGVEELLSLKVYLGWLAPVLLYGAFVIAPRRKQAQQWGVVFGLIVFNLAWYVVASISWLRYAFPALALASLFVARFFSDLTDGFRMEAQELWRLIRAGDERVPQKALRAVLLGWLAVMIVVPLAQSVLPILRPSFNGPAAMAEYMNVNVSRDVVVETWEPEMGFLTDHNYHFPPSGLLNRAVGYIWLGGTPPAAEYNFADGDPDYVLVGEFSRWVNIYPQEQLDAAYDLVTTAGNYSLYARRP
jgi:uncharacterized membrane protein YGL010W